MHCGSIAGWLDRSMAGWGKLTTLWTLLVLSIQNNHPRLPGLGGLEVHLLVTKM